MPYLLRRILLVGLVILGARASIASGGSGSGHGSESGSEPHHDLVIYGGTSAGIVAGLQAVKMGKSVVVIEPSAREGGLSTGGLGQTDIGNKRVIGGLSREFYRRIASHYAEEESWTWQKRAEYRDGGQSRTSEGEATMWTFEPSAALAVFRRWTSEVGLELVLQERLDRQDGVKMQAGRIVSITMESGRVFSGKMFLDCTYEGDLLAAAGVSYTVGREASEQYGESLNGVQVKQAKYHQFVDGVDPYVVPGDPSSGLLPFIEAAGPGADGQADARVQAYCFRMCLTDHPENRIPFRKPTGYEERWYELLLRNYEAGETGLPWINSAMPNRKTDTNNRLGFSTDFVGQNHAWPEASYDERDALKLRHRLYQQGLMWTLAYHPRMPEKIRDQVSKWGMCRDEFTEGEGWQEQLYIREARRMVGDFVMTQGHCQQEKGVEDSIGMGAYTMDSHHVQRYVDAEGHVRNEGDVEVGGFPPYPISYRAILPKATECSNLAVPVCLSASHIAFGSIRMEPVFMVLAQSAATAAALAIEEGVPLQSLDHGRLKKRLLADGQVLNHAATRKGD
ncbi:FAD dependent oxidoreductase [Planctomycetes bacterium Poly30]|uniref:FAD dependent oxidoreductase n=1 Tax=Saltatorellus ferox TaxID=2528018 RepID=A0A518EPU5_9BACT|nr:FAD dependent oxidoreductase [Planctomycetes bacterium Poly30]